MNNDFNDWYDGAPVDFGTLRFSFDDWYDGAPVPLFVETHSLTADTGAFVLTGYDVSFSVTRSITSDTGAFTLTGYDVSFSVSADATLNADTGAFLLTGYDAEFAYSPFIPPAPPTPGGGGGLGGFTGTSRKQKPRVIHTNPKERLVEAVKVEAPPEPVNADEFLFTSRAGFTMTGGNAKLILGGEDEDLAAIMLLMFDEEFDWPDVEQSENNRLTHIGAK